MKLYVLVAAYNEVIHGVFSTHELAEKYMTDHNLDDSDIVEYILDEA